MTEQAWSGWLRSTEVVALQSTRRLQLTMPSLSRGSVAELPVARLIYLLNVQRRSGILNFDNREIHFHVHVHHGTPLAKPERTIDVTQAAFGWERGSYQLEEAEVEGQTIPNLLFFIHEGIVRSLSFNDIALKLAPHSTHYLCYTTAVEERRKELAGLGGMLDILEGFDGTRPLTACMAGNVAPEDLFHAVAFGLCTDLLAIFTEPVAAPVGVSYKLRESDAEALPDGMRNTMFEIARLDRGDQSLLEELRAQHKSFTQRDPYALFGLFRGCGADAVRMAYFNLLHAYHPKRFEIYEGTPIKVVAELIFSLIRDSYQLLVAWESGALTMTPTATESAGALLDELQGLPELPQHLRVGRVPREAKTRKVYTEEEKKAGADTAEQEESTAADDFEKGVEHLERDEVFAALKAFVAASDKEPGHGRYRAYLAWCSYRCSPNRAHVILETLNKVAELPGGRVWAAVFRSRILVDQGQVEQAREHLETLRERYPGMVAIKRELAALHAASAGQSSAGVLKKRLKAKSPEGEG